MHTLVGLLLSTHIMLLEGVNEVLQDTMYIGNICKKYHDFL